MPPPQGSKERLAKLAPKTDKEWEFISPENEMKSVTNAEHSKYRNIGGDLKKGGEKRPQAFFLLMLIAKASPYKTCIT